MCFLGPFPCGLVAQGSVLGFASVCEQPCRLVHSDSVAYGVCPGLVFVSSNLVDWFIVILLPTEFVSG
jgi:hypothetical protein